MSTPTTFTPEQVLATPAGTLAQQPAELLFSFKTSAADLLTDAKSLCDHCSGQLISDTAIGFLAAMFRSKTAGGRLPNTELIR